MLRAARLRHVPHSQLIRPRTLTSTAISHARRLDLDPTGRTPGFARRRRPSSPRPSPPTGRQTPPAADSQVDRVSKALSASSNSSNNDLVAPVRVPHDEHGVLQPSHPAASILAHSSIVIQRQLEMMNVLLGFEQANKYVMMDSAGNHIGYLAERDHGFGNAIARQALRTHRSFTTHVFDRHERELLRFHRPFSWISSQIKVYDAADPQSPSISESTDLTLRDTPTARVSPLDVSAMRVVGEAQQYWAPLRRKYSLYLHRGSRDSTLNDNLQIEAGHLPTSRSTALETTEPGSQSPVATQFAYVDEPFLSWDFSLMSADGRPIGSVNRNFSGFAREIFTDTGVYVLRMDAASLAAGSQQAIAPPTSPGTESLSKIVRQDDEATKDPTPGMTLDQRAVMLATAVSIDFDYFSRHSGVGGGSVGWMPIWFPWGGGGAASEAGTAGGAAEAGSSTGGAGTGMMEGEMDEATRAAEERARQGGDGLGGQMADAGQTGYESMPRNQGTSPSTNDPNNLPDEPAPPDSQEGDFWDGWPQDGGRQGQGGYQNGSGFDGDNPGGGGGGGGDGGWFDGGDWF